jgi:hypothetical protein
LWMPFHIHSISYRLLCLANGENFSTALTISP